jgi:DNA-binding NarL/FixJ family response regulator
MNLLLVDDNLLVRKSLAGLLGDLYPSLSITCLASCEAALAHGEQAIDFVLLDFHLGPQSASHQHAPSTTAPSLEGWDCLRAIKARFPSARIIVMSAEPRQEMFELARALGAAAFVEKSVQPSILLRDLRLAFDV